AHRVVEVADASRPVGVLRAVLVVSDRLHDLDTCEVSSQLLRHDERQTRAYPGSHLRAVGDDLHRPVPADGQKHARLERFRSRHAIRVARECGSDAQQQSASAHEPAKKSSATDIYYLRALGRGPAHFEASSIQRPWYTEDVSISRKWIHTVSAGTPHPFP